MSEENPKDLTTDAERGRLLSMMADQQIQFDKFRDNANARLSNLERARSRRSSSWPNLDFEMMAGLALAVLVGMILLRVVFAALAARRREENYVSAQVSST